MENNLKFTKFYALVALFLCCHTINAQRPSFAGGRPTAGNSQKHKYHVNFNGEIADRVGSVDNETAGNSLPFGATQKPPVGGPIVTPINGYQPLPQEMGGLNDRFGDFEPEQQFPARPMNFPSTIGGGVQNFPNAQNFPIEQNFPSGQNFPVGQNFPMGQGFPVAQNFPSGQGFSTTQNIPNGPSFPGAQVIPSAQGFPNTQGFPTRQGLPVAQGIGGAQSFPQGFPTNQGFPSATGGFSFPQSNLPAVPAFTGGAVLPNNSLFPTNTALPLGINGFPNAPNNAILTNVPIATNPNFVGTPSFPVASAFNNGLNSNIGSNAFPSNIPSNFGRPVNAAIFPNAGFANNGIAANAPNFLTMQANNNVGSSTATTRPNPGITAQNGIATSGFAGSNPPQRPAAAQLPFDALGDQDLVNQLNQLPENKRPFWFLNYQAIEAQRNVSTVTAPNGQTVVAPATPPRSSFQG